MVTKTSGDFIGEFASFTLIWSQDDPEDSDMVLSESEGLKFMYISPFSLGDSGIKQQKM